MNTLFLLECHIRYFPSFPPTCVLTFLMWVVISAQNLITQPNTPLEIFEIYIYIYIDSWRPVIPRSSLASAFSASWTSSNAPRFPLLFAARLFSSLYLEYFQSQIAMRLDFNATISRVDAVTGVSVALHSILALAVLATSEQDMLCRVFSVTVLFRRIFRLPGLIFASMAIFAWSVFLAHSSQFGQNRYGHSLWA